MLTNAFQEPSPRRILEQRTDAMRQHHAGIEHERGEEEHQHRQEQHGVPPGTGVGVVGQDVQQQPDEDHQRAIDHGGHGPHAQGEEKRHQAGGALPVGLREVPPGDHGQHQEQPGKAVAAGQRAVFHQRPARRHQAQGDQGDVAVEQLAHQQVEGGHHGDARQ
ncbi:MAG: hypothetical protein QM724_06855 [Flavobacteriales bacterium]